MGKNIEIRKWLKKFAEWGLFHPSCRCMVIDGELIKEPDCCEICKSKTIKDANEELDMS